MSKLRYAFCGFHPQSASASFFIWGFCDIIKSMKLKTFIIIFVLLLLVVWGSYKYFSRKKEVPYNWALVERGDIVQKISDSGQVVPSKQIDLQFEIQGKIKDIKVKKGDEVKTGDVLAVLETEELRNQVLEAEAARDVAKAKLNKILAGSSPEEIAVYETAVENAKIALANAEISLKNYEQKLTDAEIEAENDLNQAYEDADDVFNSTYTTADQALLKTFEYVREKYFYFTDSVSSNVKGKGQIAKAVFLTAENLSQLKSALEKIREALSVIREAMEEPAYQAAVSATDETSIDTERATVDGAITDIITAEQAIASQKIDNQVALTTAQSNVDTAQNTVWTAQGDLQSAEDKLAQIKALPRQVDVDLYQAQLKQAEASLTAAYQKVSKAFLTAPLNGLVSEISKEEGEMVRLTELMLSLIPKTPFQIKVDIYEEDIVKIRLGNPVDIIPAAFPDKALKGKVISIDPAEKLIGGVVYYEVTIDLEEKEQGIKSGMTVDIIITTGSKENILIIPEEAVQTKDGQTIAQVLKEKIIKDREIEIGLRGSDDKVEVISGLEQGEKVITR